MKNILMNTEMTKAILDGRKTQTRRAIKVDTVMYNNPEILDPDSCVKFHFSAGGCQNYSSPPLFINSKYQKGDIVWVREPARVSILNEPSEGLLTFEYVADDKLDITDKRYQVNLHKIETPERFTRGFGNDCDEITAQWIINKKGVPNGCIKEMARIFLKITDVRVERLQNIGYDEISLEGFDVVYKDCSGLSYEERRFDWWIKLWDKNAPIGYKWDNNPYVIIYEFERVEK